MAIAQTQTLEAFQVLCATFAKARDPWFLTAVLSAIALTRQQEATDWLLGLLEKEDPHAIDVQEALCRSAPSAATIERLTTWQTMRWELTSGRVVLLAGWGGGADSPI